jgi:hypothetical protein
MAEEDDYSLVPHSSGALIPSAPLSAGVLSSLVEQTLLMVKREEEPAEQQGISILFADWDDDFVDFFEDEMRSRCGGYPLKVIRCGEAPHIVQMAAATRFDIAILTLNNVFGIGPSVNERVQVMLKIVRDLKSIYGMPIIALTGYYDSDDLPDRAREAGVDVFRDREDTADLGSLVQLYLARAKPGIPWKK